MKFVDILTTANQSLLRNKARTILTIIAIFIGASTLSLTNGIGSGIKTYLHQQVGSLGDSNSLTITAASKTLNFRNQSNGLPTYTPGEKKIAAEGRPGQTQIALTQSDVNKIETVPGIVSAQPTLTISPDYIASIANPNAKFEFALDETIGSNTLTMTAGSPVNNKASVSQLTIPSSYLSSLGFANDQTAIGQTVTIGTSDASGNQSTYQATITGVQQKTLIGSTAAYANAPLFNQLYKAQTVGLPQNTVNAYASVTALYSPGLTTAQVTTLKATLATDGYSAETLQDQESTIFTVISAITDVFDGFAIITLIAAAFGIVNTLYMSVSERTKEIGLMKALGMGKRRIFLLFSIEAVLIGFWGSLLGVGFANLVGRLVNTIASKGFLKDFTGLQLLSFPAKPSLIIILSIMIIAFLAGTLPARRASEKDPIEALRYE